MGPYAIVEGADLAELLAELSHAVERGDKVYKITACVDGGLKVKVNEGMWSAPLGRMVDSY